MYPQWQVRIIKNEKDRLGQEEIDRMVWKAEQFASEDKAQRKKIEALNSLSSFVYGLKSQVGDQEGLGGGMNIFFFVDVTLHPDLLLASKRVLAAMML